VTLVRLRRPKAACSSSYADYRRKTNAAILWDMGHTKGRLCMGEIGQGKGTKNLFFFTHLFICACIVGAVSSPDLRPLLLPPPRFQAELALPFSPILLKRKTKT
jgi:hypothetical protein